MTGPASDLELVPSLMAQSHLQFLTAYMESL
jgi:hypothetical protein